MSGQAQTLGEIVASNADRWPTGVAIIDRNGTTTWAELDREANRVANGLLSTGLHPGDRVATIVSNSREAMEIAFGLAKAGLVAVPLNFGLTEGELSRLIEDSRPKSFIVEFGPGAVFAESFRNRERVFFLGKSDDDWEPAHGSFEKLKLNNSDARPDVRVHPDDLRTVRYTSGTTGTPKGCMGTHRQIIASIDNFLDELPIPRHGLYLQALPLFSGAGIWMAVCAARAEQGTVMLEKFEPPAALRAIDELGVTHTYAVPTIISRLADEYESGDYDCRSLELIGYGGSPMPRALIERALDVLPCGFYQGFGGGEMGGLVTYLRPEDHEAVRDATSEHRVKSVGRPARYATVRVVDDNDNPLGHDQIGEVVVRSPSNFSGYWDRQAETAETIRGDWVYTGDVGYFDHDDYLYVVDRKKDLILTGGMNVSSSEVEEAMMEHPAVWSVAVVGVPDDEWGEAVTAAVVLRQGASATEAELTEAVRARLAGYKTPKRVVILEDLPMNSAGKVLKRELRSQLAADQAEGDG